MANSSSSFSIGGLNSAANTVGNAGEYTIAGRLQLPNQTNDMGWSVSQPTAPVGVPSQVVATVSQNGSPVLTTTAGQNSFSFLLLCAANDVISVALTSSAAIDAIPNMVRAAITIS